MQEKRSEAQKTLELVDSYLKEHAQDEWLISGLAGVEAVSYTHLTLPPSDLV